MRLGAGFDLTLIGNQDGSCQAGENAMFNHTGNIVEQGIQLMAIHAGFKTHIQHQAAIAGDTQAIFGSIGAQVTAAANGFYAAFGDD